MTNKMKSISSTSSEKLLICCLSQGLCTWVYMQTVTHTLFLFLHIQDPENAQVLIIPDVIIYGDIYCTNSKLTFSRNCMNVESSSVNATKGTFSCQWTIEDIIKIESQWCLEVSSVRSSFYVVFLNCIFNDT